MQYNIHALDYLVVLLYIVVIFFMAFKSGKVTIDEDSPDLVGQQYLAGKSLTFRESLFSIIATEVSALTFLGIPAFAYGKDFSFIHIYFGAAIGRFIIAQYFIPKIYDKGITIYSVMGTNGTVNGQRFTAIFFVLNKLLAIGVRLFSGSILVAEFFNLSIVTALFLVSLLTFLYTLVGGLKAVVQTDSIQMFLFIIGGILAHYLIPQVANMGWGEMMSMAAANNKLTIIDPSNLGVFLTGVIGGILFDMATHGVDQDFVQRLTGNKSMKGAQKAIIFSTVLSISVGLLFLGIGALLWSYYQNFAHPAVPNDKLFAYFITQHFPTGMKGLMVAGVLAATMSTLDSTINALSACFYNDILHHKTHDKHQISTFYKRDTFVITALLMIVAIISSTSEGILILGLRIASWTSGSLLALFFASILWNKFTKIKLDTISVLGAYIFGIAGVYLNASILKLAWQWNVYWGFAFAMIFLIIKGRSFDKADDRPNLKSIS